MDMASNEENYSATPEFSEQVKESMDEENAGNLATHAVHKNNTILTDLNSVVDFYKLPVTQVKPTDKLPSTPFEDFSDGIYRPKAHLMVSVQLQIGFLLGS